MFEHGNADVQDLDFCARITAKRKVALEDAGSESIYAATWDMTTGAVSQEILTAEGTMAKYFEKQHMENVEEKAEAAAKRKANRTRTDAVFADSLKKFAQEEFEDEDDEEEAEQEQRDSEQMADRPSFVSSDKSQPAPPPAEKPSSKSAMKSKASS